MKTKNLALAVIVSLITVVGALLVAGPTVIQDNRITNLATTPVLGRGYTISTNTFQSTCLKDIVMTDPSYDMVYTFKDMSEVLESSSTETDALTKVASNEFKNYLLKKEVVQKEVLETTKSGAEETSKQKTVTTQRLMAEIKLHSYYASVDESSTKITEPARKLLSGNDIPGFFHSCGSYYVRSIGRQSVYYAMYEFESVSEAEDKTFAYHLETQLKSFRKRVVTDARNWYDYQDDPEKAGSTKEWDVTSGQKISQGMKTDSFSKSSEKRNLTITVAAFGLGKNEKASLISYDIETFKAAIKDAFLSMQDISTGKVISIEVVPWVENVDFQSLVELEKKQVISATQLIGGKLVPVDVKPLLLYEKKQILSSNAEFLAELERADRSMMNLYYKAKMCRQNIDASYKKGAPGKKTFRKAYIGRYVMNNRYPKGGVLLDALDKFLTKERIDGLLKKQKVFMYGKDGAETPAGARVCISKIMKSGVFRISFRDIKECTDLQEVFGQGEEELVENHCMPRLFQKGQKPQEIDDASVEGPVATP
ncbi:MAG: hypothetical protein GY754_27145 [bacterium]|nr:hypothetical protein [bacterium]